MKLFNFKKLKGSGGFGLDELIGFLVLFGVAIIIVVVMLFVNKFI